jgi:hypothetical protein
MIPTAASESNDPVPTAASESNDPVPTTASESNDPVPTAASESNDPVPTAASSSVSTMPQRNRLSTAIKEFSSTLSNTILQLHVLNKRKSDEIDAVNLELQQTKARVESLKAEMKSLKTMREIQYDARGFAIKKLLEEAPGINLWEVKWRERKAFGEAASSDDYFDRIHELDELFKKKTKRQKVVLLDNKH